MIRIDNAHNLTTLNLSNAPVLSQLVVYDTGLADINLSQNKQLESISVYGNQLENINLTSCTKLNHIDLNENKLTSIDLTKATELIGLLIHNNNISHLDLSKNTKLELLSVSNNQLKTLDLSKNKKLVYVQCEDNQLTNLKFNSTTLKNIYTCTQNPEAYVGGIYSDNNQLKKASSFKVSNVTYNKDGVSPTVKYGNSTLKLNTDYVIYNNQLKVGSRSIVILGNGKYSGTKKATIKVNPAGTTISSITAGKKKLTVKVKKQSTQTTGYEIQYATNSKFTSAKSVKITKNTTLSKAISGLKAKKKYYVRVRTYKTVSSKNYYSSWSKAQTKKTK